MKTKNLLRWVLPLLLLTVLLTACGHSSVALAMRETHILDRWKASYSSFTGVKTHTLQADAGQSLALTYDVQVDEGTLSLQVKNADGELVWEEVMQVARADTVNVPTEQTGRYTILIQGEQTSGSWDVNWRLQ